MKNKTHFIVYSFLFIFLFAKAPFAATYFDQGYTVWQDGEYLLFTLDAINSLDPNEFCLSIRRINSGIGKPSCRVLGEWERDTTSILYGNWLKNNLEKGVTPDLLKARSREMQIKIESLEDKTVLFFTKSGNELKVAVFDETSVMPKAAGSVPYSSDKVVLGDAIANKFLKKSAIRRLTKAEREKKAGEPAAIYKEEPKIDVWTGASIAYSQARIPLTPYNWYRNKLNSKVLRYRITQDSTSLWNFLDDKTMTSSFYWGATWFGVFGAEIFYKYSNHDVKYDNKDTSYVNLKDWSYSMHEIGLSIHITHTFHVANWLTSSPFAYAGFQYSFLNEEISLKKGTEKSALYNTRIKFDDTYKGGVFGIGSRFVFFENYGIVFRTGIATRGKPDYTSPDVNAAASETTIGKITVEGFVSAGLEYHWTWK